MGSILISDFVKFKGDIIKDFVEFKSIVGIPVTTILLFIIHFDFLQFQNL